MKLACQEEVPGQEASVVKFCVVVHCHDAVMECSPCSAQTTAGDSPKAVSWKKTAIPVVSKDFSVGNCDGLFAVEVTQLYAQLKKNKQTKQLHHEGQLS